jgi:hypothetical protein
LFTQLQADHGLELPWQVSIAPFSAIVHTLYMTLLLLLPLLSWLLLLLPFLL